MDPSVDDEDLWPGLNPLGTGFGDSAASLSVMCNLVRFEIYIDVEDLRSELPDLSGKASPLVEQFLYYRDNFDEEVEDFEGWAFEPCIPLFLQLAPAPDKDHRYTLRDYYCAPAYRLRLKCSHGDLVAEMVDEIPLIGDVLNDEPRQQRHLAQFNLSHLTQLEAATLQIVIDHEMDFMRYCAVPKLVQREGCGPTLAYKTVEHKGSFNHENAAYSALLQSPPPPSENICLPKLYGFAVLGEKVIGILLEYIVHSGTMAHLTENASRKERKRWLDQMTETLD